MQLLHTINYSSQPSAKFCAILGCQVEMTISIKLLMELSTWGSDLFQIKAMTSNTKTLEKLQNIIKL